MRASGLYIRTSFRERHLMIILADPAHTGAHPVPCRDSTSALTAMTGESPPFYSRRQGSNQIVELVVKVGKSADDARG